MGDIRAKIYVSSIPGHLHYGRIGALLGLCHLKADFR